MIFKRIDIQPENNVYMNCYLHETEERFNYGYDRPAVVVCPGGAYFMCSPAEADPIAMQYLSMGYNAFVVYYTLGNNAVFPKPIIDLSKAMKIIRDNSKEWNVIPDKIAVCGFSAGGHLAASLGVHWNSPEVAEGSNCKNGENKPNALILCYPVITASGWMKSHLTRLIGNRNFEQTEKLLDCSKNVGPHTPPTFLTHTFMDNTVPVKESMAFADALESHDIPFEMHIFPHGGHGMALGTEQSLSYTDESFSKWVELSRLWLKRVFSDKEKPDYKKRAKQIEE